MIGGALVPLIVFAGGPASAAYTCTATGGIGGYYYDGGYQNLYNHAGLYGYMQGTQQQESAGGLHIINYIALAGSGGCSGQLSFCSFQGGYGQGNVGGQHTMGYDNYYYDEMDGESGYNVDWESPQYVSGAFFAVVVCSNSGSLGYNGIEYICNYCIIGTSEYCTPHPDYAPYWNGFQVYAQTEVEMSGPGPSKYWRRILRGRSAQQLQRADRAIRHVR